jgi:hypothetical protein
VILEDTGGIANPRYIPLSDEFIMPRLIQPGSDITLGIGGTE